MWHAWERGGGMYRILVGKPKGKRPWNCWENVLKMDLRETGSGGMEWILLAQGRNHWQAVVNAVLNLQVLAPRS
jgi:hypothetical protein